MCRFVDLCFVYIAAAPILVEAADDKVRWLRSANSHDELPLAADDNASVLYRRPMPSEDELSAKRHRWRHGQRLERPYAYENMTEHEAVYYPERKLATAQAVDIVWKEGGITCGVDYSLGVTDVETGMSWGFPMSEREKVNIAPGFLWRNLFAGYSHSCGITIYGETVCWGRNIEGQCDVPRGVLFTQISLGEAITCAITELKTLLCWGASTLRRLEVPPSKKMELRLLWCCQYLWPHRPWQNTLLG
jgi:hypothetical protein